MTNRLARRSSLPALTIALAALALPAHAHDHSLDAQKIYRQSLAATCANCHGTNGVSVAGDSIPAINGLTSAQIQERMLGYKDGSLPGTIMPQLAKGYTEEQIKIVADVLGKKN